MIKKWEEEEKKQNFKENFNWSVGLQVQFLRNYYASISLFMLSYERNQHMIKGRRRKKRIQCMRLSCTVILHERTKKNENPAVWTIFKCRTTDRWLHCIINYLLPMTINNINKCWIDCCCINNILMADS